MQSEHVSLCKNVCVHTMNPSSAAKGTSGVPYKAMRDPVGAATVLRSPLPRWFMILVGITLVVSLVAAGLCAAAFGFGLTAWNDNKPQDVRLAALETGAINEAAIRAAADTTLQMEVDDRLSNINGVHGANGTLGVTLVSNNTAITITPDVDGHQVFLDSAAILSVEGVTPTADGAIFLEAQSMITLTTDTNTSTLLLNDSAIVTQISNLQAQLSMQQIQILELQQNATTVETVVNALVTALQALQGDNSTQSLNDTIASLVTSVAMATVNVALLQAQVANLTIDSPMPGMLVPWSGASGGPIPDGWLLCDGTEYNISDYPALYAVVGTMYCGGPCSGIDMFAVPDMRGRIPVHKGGTALNVAIGTSVGAETHTLSSGEMPTHAHTGSTNTDGAHGHTWWVHAGTGGHSSPGGGVACNANPPFGGLQVNDIGSISCGDSYINEYWTGLQTNQDITFGNYPPSSPVHSHAFTTNNAGSGGAHNNIQPSLVMQYIIKT